MLAADVLPQACIFMGNLLTGAPILLARRLQNALVGLVQQEKIHVFCRQTGLL